MSPALCAQPGCQAEVGSLPAYMCADCGQRFCDEHLWINAAGVEVCGRCYDAAPTQQRGKISEIIRRVTAHRAIAKYKRSQ